ncbi:hypothetical protein LJB82_04070, partial [Desulfovibrio sp. OttesenSCG-928-M16]|nr:hypothetical protein [Desulfovibrio sp. OttesenSCG-928-M16]
MEQFNRNIAARHFFADVDVAVNAQSTQESMGGALYAATGMGVVTGSAFLKNLVEAKGGEIKAGTLSAGTGSQSYYASLSTIGEGLQTTFSPSHSITSKTSITAAGGAIYANGHLAGLTSSL